MPREPQEIGKARANQDGYATISKKLCYTTVTLGRQALKKGKVNPLKVKAMKVDFLPQGLSADPKDFRGP